jgi:hypothetical protein
VPADVSSKQVRDSRWQVTNPRHCFQRGSVLLCLYLSILVAVSFAQSPQNRYLAYSTYDPQPGITTHAAVNSTGLLCVAGDTVLYQLHSDGSLAYSKTISANVLQGVAIDAAGNCYTAAGSAPASPMSVTKYDTQGNKVFAVNYTGSGVQTVGAIAIDASGNIWTVGSTTSNDLRTVNPIQATLKGSMDAFVAEFNSAGTLVFSTYFGGSNNDSASALAVDANGNAYFTGGTSSTDFPILNPLESSPNSGFLAKIDNAGHLLYSTYLGATAGCGAGGVAADASMNMFVAGAGICKLNASGSAVVYSVVTGGGGPIAVDSQGNAYSTACVFVGLGPPVCPFSSLVNPIQSDSTTIDLVGLDPNGNVIFLTPFGNYLGNLNFQTIYSLGVDSAGNLYADTAVDGQVPSPLLKAVNGTYPCANCQSFVAKIALGMSASFSMPGNVDFVPTPVGSNQQIPINIYNTGTSSITISAITIPPRDYTQTNNCSAILAPATLCSLTLTFAPSAAGVRNGAVTITDNSPGSPHTIQLTGSGAVPVVTLSPTSLTFATQSVGTTSTPQIVTLTNSGGATLSINLVSISGDFAETNTCGISLSAGLNCTFSVTFNPATTGSRTGTLTLTDNAAGSPQMLSLSGTGGAPSPGLAVASSSSSSATVPAGMAANYTFSIGGQGLSGNATLSCTGAPMAATCSIPATANVSATIPSTFKVSVNTMARSSALLVPSHSEPGWMWAIGLLGLILLPGVARGTVVRRLRVLPFAMLLLLSGCGGGSSNQGGTPAGTYTLTVTASMGSTTQSTPITLTVQ